ncbi:hypothetical protein F2Q69_00063923 [Brassica cretica]|uniref:NB-ARC domain-containing protein n=1 Tax=Brassica cretica TaxID=69181 RepID=A0A8S9RJA7_BRACR|nr:hypothetical protein F2Q69_00063923 [Brassica cretica]
MGVDVEMEVQCLQFQDAFDLFKTKVGEITLRSDPNIQNLASIVAKKCHGLPLALTLSRLCLRFVTPPLQPPVRHTSPPVRHSSASSLHAACLRYLILRLWCASTTPAVLYSRLSTYQISEPRCLYDLDLMPNIESPCARTTPTITASHTSLRRNNNIVS